MAYRIRDWDARYEVNDKNRALKPGEKMRQGPLEYLRFPVHGRDHSAAYRRFLREAKDDAPAVYGVYVKLKEIAAQSEAGKRGVVRNDSGDAIEADEIADLMGFPVKVVAKSLAILCREGVGWVEQFRDSPENPGISPSESYTETETETETETVPPVGGDTCPLRHTPKIARLYEGIRVIIREVHPHAKLADVGTARELEDRKELARIVRLDGYDEQAVIDTLGYVLQDEPHSDKFMWRDQLRSFSGLRKVSNGATKFSRMHDAMKKFKESTHKSPIPPGVPQKPPYPGMVFEDGAWIHP